MVYTTHLFWFWGWFIVVLGVDAVKGPCAVSIFSVLCVLLVIVIVNRVGGVGGDVNVLCDCKVLLHFHTYVMLRYC